MGMHTAPVLDISGVLKRISDPEVIPIQSSTHCDVKPVGIFPSIRLVDV